MGRTFYYTPFLLVTNRPMGLGRTDSAIRNCLVHSQQLYYVILRVINHVRQIRSCFALQHDACKPSQPLIIHKTFIIYLSK